MGRGIGWTLSKGHQARQSWVGSSRPAIKSLICHFVHLFCHTYTHTLPQTRPKPKQSAETARRRLKALEKEYKLVHRELVEAVEEAGACVDLGYLSI